MKFGMFRIIVFVYFVTLVLVSYADDKGPQHDPASPDLHPYFQWEMQGSSWKGDEAFSAGDYEGAIRWYDEVIGKNPESMMVKFFRAMAVRRQNLGQIKPAYVQKVQVWFLTRSEIEGKHSELTPETIQRNILLVNLLKQIVEASSNGSLSMDIKFQTIEAPLTRLYYWWWNKDWCMPDINSISPFPTQLMFDTVGRTDLYIYFWAPICNCNIYGGGKEQPLFPGHLMTPKRGFVYINRTDFFHNFFHEYTHSIETLWNAKWIHLDQPERKKLAPNWPRNNEPLSYENEISFISWLLENAQTELFLNNKDSGRGWGNFSYLPDNPFNMILEDLDAYKELYRGEVDKGSWKFISADSQEFKGEYAPAHLAFDRNSKTFWHTEWKDKIDKLPHEIVIDMGKQHLIKRFSYLARQDGSTNGDIEDYELYISKTLTFDKPVFQGRFPHGKKESFITLPQPPKGRYLKLRALSSQNGQPFTAIAEISVYSK